jgi:ubiquinone/menaquinone biosynthesis C-methylase UbiE
LNIGCGNGEIQDLLYEAGYHKIFNNDISSVVIEQMSKIKQSKKFEEMVYEVMDACSMTYADQMFDLVLDKSTIDALLCSETPVISVA